MHTYKQILLALSALQAINGDDFVRFPVRKHYQSSQDIQKRSVSGELQFEIDNLGYHYTVDVILGSNNQSVSASLDTGSSDLWVLGENAHGVNACDAYLQAAGYTSSNNQEFQYLENQCSQMGVFNPYDSKTFKEQKPNIPFYAPYYDKHFAYGYWGSDTLSVNGVAVNNLLFAVANVSNLTSVCGVGFLENEFSNHNYTAQLNPSAGNLPVGHTQENGISFTYNNLPFQMKQQGLINRVSYSLFLNSYSAKNGDLLFGAIDKSKYVGNLNTVPLVNIFPNKYKHPTTFHISLQGVGFVNQQGGVVTFNQQLFPAVADSGSTFLIVPKLLANLMAAQVGAVYHPENGFFMMNCPSTSAMHLNAYVLQIGGINYFFPLADFILTTNSPGRCLLGITPGGDQNVILGDNVLRSLYVVYDLEKYELSLARANYAGADINESSSIVSIPTATSPILLATKAPGYYTTWTSFLNSFVTGGDIFSGSTSVSNPWTATPASYFGTNTGVGANTAVRGSTTTTLTGTATTSGVYYSGATNTNSKTDGNGYYSGATNTGTKTNGNGYYSGPTSSASSAKSKNGAGVVGSSLMALLAALFM